MAGKKRAKKLNTKFMGERQVSRAYFQGKITKSEHDAALHRIAGARYATALSKKKDRSSMSSSKWR